MDRRGVLKLIEASIIGAVTPAWIPFSAKPAAMPPSEQTPVLAKYQRLKFGVSYHFAMGTFTNVEYDPGSVPATTYNPTRLDVRQWIRVAHELGAKYAVLTTKHMSGFCLWDAKDYDYDAAASGDKTECRGGVCCRLHGIPVAARFLLLHSRPP